MNAINAEKEELEWSNARKSTEASAVAKSKGNKENNAPQLPPPSAEAKKTGLEREKDDLQKVIQKKNEELNTIKKTLTQS